MKILNNKENLLAKMDQQIAVAILQDMIRVRKMEESCAELYAEEKIRGFLHLYIGEEAIACSIIRQLSHEDQLFCTYREHAHALMKGISMNAIMAEMFGKVDGCSKGRGGSMHLFDVSKNFYGGNAIVAGHLPLAVGMGLANIMQKRDSISVCFFGEGAIAEGEFHEAMNLAALWKVPVLFICENNFYAMGTSLERSESQLNLVTKAQSYNIQAKRVNGMSVSQIFDAAKSAIDYVRKEGRPFFLECETYRFKAHSMFDPELYRTKEEVERWKKSDPIKLFSHLLLEMEWVNTDEIEQMHQLASEELKQAIHFAEIAPVESLDSMLEDSYIRDIGDKYD